MYEVYEGLDLEDDYLMCVICSRRIEIEGGSATAMEE